MIRKIFSLVVSITLIFPSTAFAAGELFEMPSAPGKGYFGFSANTSGMSMASTAGLSGREVDEKGRIKSVKNCQSLSDPKCSKMNFFMAAAPLPLCFEKIQMNCIDSVNAFDSAGKVLKVKTGMKFPGVRPDDFAGDLDAQLPSGGQVPVVEIPDAPHNSGARYMVVVRAYGDVDLRSTAHNRGKFNGNLTGGIFAFKSLSGGFSMAKNSENIAEYDAVNYSTERIGLGYLGDPRCITNDATTCAVAQEIPADLKFELKVRINFKILNWFSGRMLSPEMNLVELNPGEKLLTISGQVAQTPIVSRWAKKTELPASIIDYYKSLPQPIGGTGDIYKEQQSGDPSTWSILRGVSSLDQNAMDEFLLWLPVFGDKSDYLQSAWSFKSISSYSFNLSCLQSEDGVAGIVSTNATLYIDGPPVFNSESMSLEYKVAAPHFTPEGEIFKGTYDLQIRTSLARCLYGFSNAPISATIEIVSESGEKQIAATTVIEKNEWLYLSARGFTFSSPVVRVKLSQEEKALAKLPKETKFKERTITCFKGKKVQRIYDVKPKCPTGYKKR